MAVIRQWTVEGTKWKRKQRRRLLHLVRIHISIHILKAFVNTKRHVLIAVPSITVGLVFLLDRHRRKQIRVAPPPFGQGFLSRDETTANARTRCGNARTALVTSAWWHSTGQSSGSLLHETSDLGATLSPSVDANAGLIIQVFFNIIRCSEQAR